MSAKKASAKSSTKKTAGAARKKKAAAGSRATKKKTTTKAGEKKTAKKAARTKVTKKKTAKKAASKVTKKTAKKTGKAAPKVTKKAAKAKVSKAKVSKKKTAAKTSKKKARKSRKRRRHPQLTPKVLEGLRRRLLEKRRELIGSVATSAGDRRDQKLDGTEDYIDYAVNSYDREFLLSLTEMDQKELFLVEDALRRMDRREYGYCMASGDEIPLKRLEVQPWARYSVHNQELVDQGLLPDTLFRHDAGAISDPLEDDLEAASEDDVQDDEEGDGDEEGAEDGAAAETAS